MAEFEKEVTKEIPPELLRSVRTVFRIQFHADRLRDDLHDADLKGVQQVLFVQRHWRDLSECDSEAHSEPKSQKVYLANCCATWRLDSSHVRELEYAATRSDTVSDGLKFLSLNSLFEAYDKIEVQKESSKRFLEYIKEGDSQNLPLAHERLIDAASKLPFQGELPSAADAVIGEEDIGVWFRTTEKTSVGEKFQFLPFPKTADSSWKSLDDTTHQEATFAGISGDQSHLRAAFDDFLNAFLLGLDPQPNPPCYPKIGTKDQLALALPCYEHWKKVDGKEKKAGAFLGWVFLIFGVKSELEVSFEKRILTGGSEGNSTQIDESILIPLRLCLNQFTDRVLDAKLVECIADYSQKSSEHISNPKSAFEYYFQLIEGWLIKENDGIELFKNIGDEAFPDFKIKKKEETIGESAENAPPAVVFRAARLFRALKAFYQANEADGYRKQAEMLRVINRPLRRISGALSAMQSDTQELRAILYEPEEALFASYSLIEPFFREGYNVRELECLPAGLIIKHTPDKYTPEECKLALACVLCCIFGKLHKLQDHHTADLVIAVAKDTLSNMAKDSATEDLAKDLLWLAEHGIPDKNVAGTLPGLLDQEKDSQVKMLGRLKCALFTPFKVESATWPRVAFWLLAQHEKFKGVKWAGELAQFEDPSAGLTIPESPVSYAAVLAFIRDLVTALSECDNPLKTVSWFWDNSSRKAICSLKFEKSIPDAATGIDRKYLKDSLALVASMPREWRIDNSNHGDTTRPFVYLVNKIIGMDKDWEVKDCQGQVFVIKRNKEPKVCFSINAPTDEVFLNWQIL